jgi:transcriptional regulator with XRE-family HTH domain
MELTIRLDAEELQRSIAVRLKTAQIHHKQLDEPNLPAVRRSLGVLREAIEELNRTAELSPAVDKAVEQQVLQQSLPSLLALRSGDFDGVVRQLFLRWVDVARMALVGSGLHIDVGKELERAPLSENPWLKGFDDSSEWQVTFNTGLVELFRDDLAAGRARSALRRLMVHLDLSQDDLGRLFSVSGETIRRWERGKSAVPAHKEGAILAAEEGLDRLLEIFRPERLPAAVRRPADLFGGESALDWILRGRIAEVADRYETTLRYQA